MALSQPGRALHPDNATRPTGGLLLRVGVALIGPSVKAASSLEVTMSPRSGSGWGNAGGQQPEPVDRGGRRHVEAVVIGVAPRAVRGLLGEPQVYDNFAGGRHDPEP